MSSHLFYLMLNESYWSAVYCPEIGYILHIIGRRKGAPPEDRFLNNCVRTAYSTE